MVFRLTLQRVSGNEIPVNYSYPLSAAIYKIIAKGNQDYAEFLHNHGYGKGFKFFSFSQIKTPFELCGEYKDRMRLKGDTASFQVSFHLPDAMSHFVKGLFNSEYIEIADSISQTCFFVKSIETLRNPLEGHLENEIVNVTVHPLSPIVAGVHNEKGNYDFLAPDHPQFIDSLIFNWRNKIATHYSESTAQDALLMMNLKQMKYPPKSRLITIKADTQAETKIRGWMNFELQLTAEKRFVDLLLNAGVGLYNAQGMGCVGVVSEKYYFING